MKYGQKVTTCPLTLCMTRNLKKGFGRVQNVRSGYLQPECKKKKKLQEKSHKAMMIKISD